MSEMIRLTRLTYKSTKFSQINLLGPLRTSAETPPHIRFPKPGTEARTAVAVRPPSRFQLKKYVYR